MAEPEWSNAPLRNPVVGSVEPGEVGNAVSAPGEAPDLALDHRPVRRVVEPRHVGDQVRVRA